MIIFDGQFERKKEVDKVMLRPAEICDLARNGLEAGFSQLTSSLATLIKHLLLANGSLQPSHVV